MADVNPFGFLTPLMGGGGGGDLSSNIMSQMSNLSNIDQPTVIAFAAIGFAIATIIICLNIALEQKRAERRR